MSYPGAKAGAGVWQRIIGQMPPHHVYVEAFSGSAQVFHRKRSAGTSILIDRNEECLYIRNKGANAIYTLDESTGYSPAWRDLTAFPGVHPVHGDALRILPRLSIPGNSVVYCDPPYMLSTRRGRRYYEHELTDDQHEELLSIVRTLSCGVLISHPPCPLYNEKLKAWRCIRYQTMTRGGKKADALWCNFQEPAELHDWRYAGANFRQRCWLNRVRRRILAKLAAMPTRKRGFVLNAIREVYPA